MLLFRSQTQDSVHKDEIWSAEGGQSYCYSAYNSCLQYIFVVANLPFATRLKIEWKWALCMSINVCSGKFAICNSLENWMVNNSRVLLIHPGMNAFHESSSWISIFPAQRNYRSTLRVSQVRQERFSTEMVEFRGLLLVMLIIWAAHIISAHRS